MTAEAQPAFHSAEGMARVRFVAVRAQAMPSGRAHVEVELERPDGSRVVCARAGEPSAVGVLRVAAEATVDALHEVIASEMQFSLVGVKTVRAFDQAVILVLLTTRLPRGLVRLVGAAVGDSGDDADVARATVLAVLNASNRAIGRPAS